MNITKETAKGTMLTADPRWQLISTGGNCTALSREVGKSDASYWLLTQAEDASAPEGMDEPVILGLYEAEGDQIGYWDCATVWAALAIANGFNV